MSLKDVLSTLAEVPTLLQVTKETKARPLTTRDCLAARVERTAARFPTHTAVIFEGQSLTWTELNAKANRCSSALRAQGLVAGDTVSLIMENRIEFLTSLIALNKLGAITALINTNLVGSPLIHCIKITKSKMCIFGEERLQEIADVKSDPGLECVKNWLFVIDAGKQLCPAWATNLEEGAENNTNPAQTNQNTLADVALYMYNLRHHWSTQGLGNHQSSLSAILCAVIQGWHKMQRERLHLPLSAALSRYRPFPRRWRCIFYRSLHVYPAKIFRQQLPPRST